MLFVNEVHIWQVCLVENDAHHCLPSANRTVDLCVNLVNAHRISLPHEGVEDIFTEFFSLNNNLLALRVDLRVKDCKSVDAIGLLGNARGNRARVESVETGSAYH